MIIARSRREQVKFRKGMELYEYLSKQGEYCNYRQTVAEFRVGDSVHLKDKNGTYIIKGFERGYVAITCKKWQVELQQLQRASDVVVTRMSNIKCHVGVPKMFK